MRNLIISIIFILLGSFSATVAQETEGVKKEGAHEAEYNANAQERDHAAEIDSRSVNNGDTTGIANQGANDNSKTGNTSTFIGAGSPAGDSRTSSSSGSPGILMEDADQADGTNTVQQAQPNIAGSPVPGGRPSGNMDKKRDERSGSRTMDAKAQKSSSTDEVKTPEQRTGSDKKESIKKETAKEKKKK